MPSPSKILCPETQEEEALMNTPPRTAPINLDYSLLIKRVEKGDFPHSKFHELASGWAIITPLRELGALMIDLQSMTWKRFQRLAIAHLGPETTPLGRLLSGANGVGALEWQASILGNIKYDPSKNYVIRGDLDFINFSTKAYEEFPNRVLFKLVMSQASRKNAGNVRSDIVVDVDFANGIPHEGGSRPKKGIKRTASNVSMSSIPAKKALPAPEDLSKGTPTMKGPSKGSKKTTAPESSGEGFARTDSATEPQRPGPPPSDANEIEIVEGPTRNRAVCRIPNGPGEGEVPVIATAPLGPEAPALEAVDLETYLTVSHIDAADHATRRRLRANGIIHWTFFRSSSERELTRMGFPLGIARLLCEGIPRLESYVEHRSVPL
ncbi:hypothetical protein PGTUg99_007945 [Puccinia graminis f. sp. tritici]|uniref:Uncharacterized protein n=1 Tax=Puccinia graminis f. sp. tritici TaxID=56615 RepID=A0A5B0P4Z7_PUCGR|nr:hypothetical protein PGTUg99_007945 [Puccinia graminis f. sp. tritici]